MADKYYHPAAKKTGYRRFFLVLTFYLLDHSLLSCTFLNPSNVDLPIKKHPADGEVFFYSVLMH
ncbi:MAG: hypothetical protein ABS22_10240 [SAR92 bacterium BACL16 MAG-120322-bin99]|nr:MAG: hypothetical protein ABS22_10240 [SAR92 bacterium BACL16 MAG-120322-bin99]HAU02895.1 hypothetical protein [Porticoccaceae bacterium]